MAYRLHNKKSVAHYPSANLTRSHLIAVGLLILLGGLVYANSLGNQFVHDDNYQIVRNPYLHRDEPITRLFFTDVWGYQLPGRTGISNYYRPLQMLVYRWTAQIAGLEPFAFHLVNLVFHLLVSVMTYVLFWKLTRHHGLSISASVLFVLHPIHTEAVDWIASLPELGCALFYFLSFWMFLQWRGQRAEIRPATQVTRQGKKKGHNPTGPETASKRPALLAGSLMAFSVALLFKEMALTVPILVGAYVFTFRKEPGRWTLRFRDGLSACWPYLGVAAGYLLLRYQVLGFISKSQQVWSLSVSAQILSILYLAAQYWYKLTLPLSLNAFYTFQPVDSLADPRAWTALIFVTIAGGLIAYGFKRDPLPSFAAAWVFLTLLPVMNIRGVGINVFTERYLYIPSLGFCLLMTWLAREGLSRIGPRHRMTLTIGALTGVSVLYGIQTVRRNADWKNDFIFYSRAAEASPNSSSMQNSLSDVLRAGKGDLDGAERHALLALSLSEKEVPPDPRLKASAYLNLANVYIQRQQLSRALEMAEKGLAADGSLPNLHIVHGVALMQLGRTEEARNVFVEVNQRLPNDELVLHYLGVIALQGRDMEKAIEYFQKALKILPTYADAHNNLAAAYVELGRLNEALPHLQQAASLNSKDPMAHTNLGAVLTGLGRFPEARSHLQQALALSPNFPAAVAELVSLENKMRQTR